MTDRDRLVQEIAEALAPYYEPRKDEPPTCHHLATLAVEVMEAQGWFASIQDAADASQAGYAELVALAEQRLADVKLLREAASNSVISHNRDNRNTTMEDALAATDRPEYR